MGIYCCVSVDQSNDFTRVLRIQAPSLAHERLTGDQDWSTPYSTPETRSGHRFAEAPRACLSLKEPAFFAMIGRLEADRSVRSIPILVTPKTANPKPCETRHRLVSAWLLSAAFKSGGISKR